ncbi:MAG TPA: DUF2232 domain-containing protein [Candidatus Ozemobacteraceae bacterium]
MKQTLGQRPAGTALMVAFTLVTLFASLHTPIFGTLLLALAGLPAVFVGLAWGGAWFVVYAGLTIAGSTAYGGIATGILLVPMLLVPAGMLASAISRGFPALRSIGLALAGSMLFSFCLWSIAPVFGEAGTRLWQLRSVFERQADLIEAQIRKMNAQPAGTGTTAAPAGGASLASGAAAPNPASAATAVAADTDTEEATEAVMRQFREWMGFVALLVPITFLFGWHLLSLAVMYLGIVTLAPNHGLSVQPLPAFSTWRFDWQLIWVFLAGWLLYHGAENLASDELRHLARVIGANCLAISKLLYLIIGVSLLFYFFEKNEISTPNRVGLSVLALLMTQLLIWAGIADVWLDFRAPPPSNVNQDGDESSFFDQF